METNATDGHSIYEPRAVQGVRERFNPSAVLPYLDPLTAMCFGLHGQFEPLTRDSPDYDRSNLVSALAYPGGTPAAVPKPVLAGAVDFVINNDFVINKARFPHDVFVVKDQGMYFTARVFIAVINPAWPRLKMVQEYFELGTKGELGEDMPLLEWAIMMKVIPPSIAQAALQAVKQLPWTLCPEGWQLPYVIEHDDAKRIEIAIQCAREAEEA